MTRDPGLDFSFSGLKTALVYRCRELGDDGVADRAADLAASYQSAVVEQLVAKLDRALKQTGHEVRSEEHTSELQSRQYLVCRLLLEKKKHSPTPSRSFIL